MVPSQIEDLIATCVVSVIALGTILPLARALAKRLSQPRAKPAALPSSADSERLERIERAIEAVAVEVERIAESQRFVTRLLADGSTERLASLPGPR